MPWLSGRAESDYLELSQALEPSQKARVERIPLLFDNSASEVNAFAACTVGNAAVIVLTDGLLEVSAYLAQCQATDELFGTRKTDEYIRFIVDRQRGGEPLARPPENFWDPQQKNDPRKINRQHEIYDENAGFVTAHEMAHHYLGHLPCSAGNPTAAEANQVLTSAAPAFNQVNEVSSDTSATRNVLGAGAKRNGYHWTEGGGMLVMRFFSGLQQLRPTDIVYSFQRTHPPPQLRIPIIQQTANAWRLTGGAAVPVPTLPSLPQLF
jgi:hypothetical protein